MTLEVQPVATRERWGALIATSLGRGALGFQFQALPALAPVMAAGLGLSLSEIGTLTGLYMAPGILIALLAGALLQRISVRNTLVIGLAAMVASGILSFASSELFGLAAARLLGGLGGVLVTVATLKGFADWFPRSELSLANGVSGGAQPFGMGCALLIFSTQGHYLTWQTGLLVTGVVSAVALAAVVTLIPANGPAPRIQRPPGSTNFPLGEFVMLLLAGSVVALFVGCFYAFLSILPSFLHSTGWRPDDAGLIMGAVGWAPIVVSPIGGFFASRLRHPAVMIATCILIWGSAVAGLAFFGVTPLFIGLMLVFGPLPIGPIMSLVVQAVAAERLGIGSGVFMAFMFLGTSVIPPAAAWVGDLAPEIAGSSEATAVLFCGVAFLVSLLPLAVFEHLKRRPVAALRNGT